MNRSLAIVTGGAAGIGRAVSIVLAADGYEVLILDRENASTTVNEIIARAGIARFARTDVSSEQDILNVFAEIRQNSASLTVVVNCAGIQIIRPLLETSVDDLDRVVSVNLKGTFLVGREAARLMLEQKTAGGRIINVASELAYLGRAKYSAYCATKGAILSLTRSWARELSPHILVNCVAPGPTNTAMVSLDCMSPEELREEIAAVPLGRLAEPDEIAATVSFLASPRASYFTGQCISPNGGAVMF